MVHDTRILDFLDDCEKIAFSGTVYRVTLREVNPVAPSLRGGRWMLPNQTAVLYTSLLEDGAIAEIAYHYARFTPPPQPIVVLHEIQVGTRKTARITRDDLEALDIDAVQLSGDDPRPTQRVGAAAAFLGFDGILVPSLRWETENLVIFADNHGFDTELTVLESRELDWTHWARAHTNGPTNC